MKKGLIVVLRVVCILWTLGNIVWVWLMNQTLNHYGYGWSRVLEKWKASPFDFSDSDISVLNMTVISFIIPIILFIISFVKKSKNKQAV